MAKFLVKEHNNTLIIEQKTFSRLTDLTGAFIVFVLSLLVLFIPYDQLTEINKYAVIVYFIPIFPFIRIIKKLYNLISGHRISINKRTDQVYYNDRFIDRASNIKQVEWNIDSPTDHEESYLELRSKDNLKHRISTTTNDMDKEHLELGRRLAKFLKTEFVNNHPFEKEVLWGKYDADDKSIDQIENKY